MAQRQAVLAQLLLEPRAGGARLDAGRLRQRVHVEHAIESLEIDRHDTRIRVADRRLYPADHARAAAERDGGGAGALAPVDERLQLRLAGRVRDHVGQVVEASAEGTHDVAIGLAVGV